MAEKVEGVMKAQGFCRDYGTCWQKCDTFGEHPAPSPVENFSRGVLVWRRGIVRVTEPRTGKVRICWSKENWRDNGALVKNLGAGKKTGWGGAVSAKGFGGRRRGRGGALPTESAEGGTAADSG